MHRMVLSIIADVTSSLGSLGSLDSSLNRWEWTEYIAEFFVVLGCAGEYIADFTSIRSEKWRRNFSKRSLVVLIAALAIELGALFQTNRLSGKEITLLDNVSAEASPTFAHLRG
ncbi:MAG: hypothetical protein ACLQU1_20280 [Bryobacteraceae bacterium]